MAGHSTSISAYTRVFDALCTPVNALVSRPSTSWGRVPKDVDARLKAGHDKIK
jgi:hypothetical protein